MNEAQTHERDYRTPFRFMNGSTESTSTCVIPGVSNERNECQECMRVCRGREALCRNEDEESVGSGLLELCR